MREDSAEEPRRPRKPGRGRERDPRTGSDAAGARIQNQARWVELQVQQAMERGEFDDLPGRGKPLGDLGSLHDRDWWLRKLIEREQITGVLPEALQLRKEDAELDALLDRETAERRVREKIEDFNRRVVAARRQLQGGPPVVTATRDLDAEVERWRERLQARRQPAGRTQQGRERLSRAGSIRLLLRRPWPRRSRRD